MTVKLFKLYAKIYYNFLLGKINKSIPKLNINSLGIELNKDLLIIFPLDEESFRVAAYSFRKLLDSNNSHKYTLLINEKFKNLFYFKRTQIIYFTFNDKKQYISYQNKVDYDLYDIIINLNVNEYFEIYKLIGNINCKYKVGIKSLLSSKFYNIEYSIDKQGSAEGAYQNIKLLVKFGMKFDIIIKIIYIFLCNI